MTSALCRYWEAFQPSEDHLSFHPEDEEWLKATSASSLLHTRLKTHNDYVSSKRFGDDDGLHLSLLPLPYIGNLDRADIVIFLRNPGFNPGDYYLEENHEFEDAAIRNLHQEKIADYPFIYLNPTFAWSSGFLWWEAKFRIIIQALMQEKRWTYKRALKEISHRVAAVELFPYHSVNSMSLGKNWDLMPSALMAHDFLVQIADERKKLKIVVRSHKAWLRDSTLPNSDHFRATARTRGISFNHNLDGEPGQAGRMILKRLSQAG